MIGREPEKLKSILAAIAEMREAYTKLNNLLSVGPASYYFETMGNYIDGLFLFAKFKVDDRVCLAKDIDCPPGWAGCQHFMKAGAAGVVIDVAFNKKGFTYGVVFDRETWIDIENVERPVIKKHQFWFREGKLSPAAASTPAPEGTSE